MKFIFVILSLLTDPDAIAAPVRCCFASGVTNVAVLFVLGTYQAIRLSISRGRAQF